MNDVIDEVDELTVSDYAQFEDERPGVYVNAEDCELLAKFMAEANVNLMIFDEEAKTFQRLRTLFENVDEAQEAYHVKISDPG